MQDRTYLGVELGSTRIKAVTIDDAYRPVASGGYVWKSALRDGIWTYDLDEAWRGLKAAIAEIPDREAICAAGISGMMHGYLAFDREWQLLTPFRGDRVLPCAEGDEQIPVAVECKVAVHHAGHAHRRDFRASLHSGQRRLQPGPYLVKAVGPDAVFIPAFPCEAAGGDGPVRLVNRDRLDPGGAKLDAEIRLSHIRQPHGFSSA